MTTDVSTPRLAASLSDDVAPVSHKLLESVVLVSSGRGSGSGTI